jgi:DNA transposition AAA+ family ATPase
MSDHDDTTALATVKTTLAPSTKDGELSLKGKTLDPVRSSWRLTPAQLQANISHCSEAGKEALYDTFMFCMKENITRQEWLTGVVKIARKTDANFKFTDNLAYKIFHGKYRQGEKTGPRLDISPDKLKAIQDWLKERRVARAHSLKLEDFVITPTAERVFGAVDVARESQTIVLLFGPPHIGKSWALEYKSETVNHGRTPYVRFKANAGPQGMLESICMAINQPLASKTVMMNAILNGLNKGMVLVLDEVHLLINTYTTTNFYNCFEIMREIHDRTGVGMLLSTTDYYRDELAKYRKSELGQLFRRGAHRVQLAKGPTEADVRLILKHYGLALPGRHLNVTVRGVTEQPYEFLRQLAEHHGLLAITERLRYARNWATSEKRPVTWEDVTRAHLTIKAQATRPKFGWAGVEEDEDDGAIDY